ncbi:MAG: ribosomal protein S18-alanine N-acetyltransferase [Cocleimonas sp.]
MTEKRTLKYLRKMIHEDLPIIMQGERDAYPYPWTLGNFEDCLRNRRQFSCWVFELEDIFSGHVVLSTGAGEAHILNLCVYPDEQGKGWGRKLLAEAEWIAKQHKAETCLLEVRPSNLAGIHLYQTEGYNEIGLRKDYYPADNKNREDAIVMAKTLF